MAIQDFTLDLKAAGFPLVTKLSGRSAIIANLDQEQFGPKIKWMENVIPVADGYISVDYSDFIQPTLPAGHTLLTTSPQERETTKNYTVQTPDGSFTYFITTNSGCLIYQIADNSWTAPAEFSNFANSESRVSVFYYKGRSFAFHPEAGLYSFVYSAGQFSLRQETVNGLVLANVLSMCASFSYIIAVTADTVFWSSPVSGDFFGDTIEFDPTALVLAGAGSTKVLELQGRIQLVVAKENGFYVYTDANAVDAQYTQQPANPWFFKGVRNSSGVFNMHNITSTNNAGLHFVWSNKGLVQVDQNGAVPQVPQLTEFLTGNYFERYSYAQKEFVEQEGVTLEVQLAFLAGRYLCISYGKVRETKDFVLVLDVVYQRWGRLAVKHLSIFDMVPPKRPLPASSTFADNLAVPYSDLYNQPYTETMGLDITENFQAMQFGLITPSYGIQIVDFSDTANNGQGLIIFEGMNITGSRKTQINSMELWGQYLPEDITIEGRAKDTSGDRWFPSFYDALEEDYKMYLVGGRPEIKLEGRFKLSQALVKGTIAGRS